MKYKKAFLLLFKKAKILLLNENLTKEYLSIPTIIIIAYFRDVERKELIIMLIRLQFIIIEIKQSRKNSLSFGTISVIRQGKFSFLL